MRVRLWHRQFTKYTVVGIAATCTHVLIASIALLALEQPLLMSNMLAFFGAWFISYFGNALWSFEARAELGSMARFLVVSGLHLSMIYGVSKQVSESSLPDYTGILILLVLLPLVGFLFHKFWVFDNR